MADSYHHAVSSVKKWGGEVDNYLPLHKWMDETKDHFADPRHRAIRHHSQGIGWLIDTFGQAITLSTCAKCGEPESEHLVRLSFQDQPEGHHEFVAKQVPTRWVGEQHCLEDFGRIPTMADWLREMTVESWMVRGAVPLSRVL